MYFRNVLIVKLLFFMIPYQLFLLKTSLTGDKKSSKKIKIFFKRIYRINAVGRCVNMRKCFFPKIAATQSKFFPLYYNRDHSILKCFDILPNLFFYRKWNGAGSLVSTHLFRMQLFLLPENKKNRKVFWSFQKVQKE